MSLTDVLDDLLELQGLAADERDPKRRRSLDTVRAHVARREQGAKVAEAAAALGISQPTVRAWIDAGVLTAVPDAKPVRIEVISLADTKHALDLIRDQVDDHHLLAHVMRLLRDSAALERAEGGLDDARAGRTVPLGDDLAAEIAVLREREVGRRPGSR